MKLAITLMLDVDGECTLEDARKLRTSLTIAARQGRGVRHIEEVHATLELDPHPTLRPLTKASGDAPVPLAQVLDLSIPFMKAVAESGIEEAKARKFLAYLPSDHAGAMVDQARRRLVQETNGSLRRDK